MRTRDTRRRRRRRRMREKEEGQTKKSNKQREKQRRKVRFRQRSNMKSVVMLRIRIRRRGHLSLTWVVVEGRARTQNQQYPSTWDTQDACLHLPFSFLHAFLIFLFGSFSSSLLQFPVPLSHSLRFNEKIETWKPSSTFGTFLKLLLDINLLYIYIYTYISASTVYRKRVIS